MDNKLFTFETEAAAVKFSKHFANGAFAPPLRRWCTADGLIRLSSGIMG